MDPRDINSAKDAMRAARAAMMGGPKRSLVVIVAIIVGFLFLNPWIQIGAGERGIVLDFGAVQKDVLGEGLHFRIPVMPVSYTHLRAHETRHDLVCRLLL